MSLMQYGCVFVRNYFSMIFRFYYDFSVLYLLLYNSCFTFRFHFSCFSCTLSEKIVPANRFRGQFLNHQTKAHRETVNIDNNSAPAAKFHERIPGKTKIDSRE